MTMLMEHHGAHFRHIVLIYHYRDGRGTTEETTQITDLPMEWTQVDCLRSLHESAIERMIDGWETMSNCLKHLTRLEDIRVEVQDLHCPMGCCRTNILELLFTNHLLETVEGPLQHDPARLRMFGLRTDRERSQFNAWVQLRRAWLENIQAFVPMTLNLT